MSLTFWEYVITIVGSFLAGAINTLAGNGSLITLMILTDIIGLPGNLANGTNRIGVFFQTAGSSVGFAKNNMVDLSRSKFIMFLTIIGAIIGVYFATIVSNEQFLEVFKYLMIVMLLVILVKPERWLRSSDIKKLPIWVSVPVFLILGFYGGFIQMGMGIFFLAVLVLLSQYSIMEANAIKTLVTSMYTLIVLVIFALKGLVDWEVGILFAVGQTLGGYLTAAYASKWPNINLWAYRLLIVIVIMALLTQFDIVRF